MRNKLSWLMIASVLILLLSLGIASAQDVSELRPDEPINAALNAPDARHVYQYQGQEDETIRIIVAPIADSALDPVLELYAPDGELLAVNDDMDGLNRGALIEATLAADGTYEIILRAFLAQSSGAYELILLSDLEAEASLAEETEEAEEASSESTQEAGNDISFTDITLGQTLVAILPTGEVDRYRFSPETDVTVDIALNSSNFDTFLEVFDADDTLIADNDDSGGTFNSLISGLNLLGGETYFIVARSFADASGGQYQLSLLEASETPVLADPLPGEPVAIAYNEIVAAVLVADGEMLFQFEGAAEDVITARVESEFDAYLTLLDANGDVIAQDDDSGGNLQPLLSGISLPDDGQYILRVTGFSSFASGPFTLSLSDSDIEPSTPTPPIVRPDAGTTTTLSYGDTGAGELSSNGTVNFSFEGAEGDVIRVGVLSEFDAYLTLLNSDGEWVASDDDSGGELQPLLNNTFLPADDTYTLEVRGFSETDSGPFTISLELIDLPEPQVIRYGETLEGTLESGQLLRFVFEAEADDMITARVRSEFDAYLELLDPNGLVISSDDDSGGDLQPLLRGVILPETGGYTLILTGYSGGHSGPFSLELSLTSLEELAEDFSDGGSIGYNETLEGELSAGELVAYQFEGQAEDVITAFVTSEFDSYLELYDAEYRIIAQDDDSGGDLQPRIEEFALPESGTYILVVRGYNSSYSGPYSLTLQSGEVFTTVVEPVSLNYGESFEGQLSAGSIQPFTFEAEAGDMVTIRVQAPFDGVMRVFNPDGEEIAFDDDSGGSLNPLIEGLTLEADGLYTIELFAFNNRESGTFTFSLESTDAPISEPEPIIPNEPTPSEPIEPSREANLNFGETQQGNLALGSRERFTFEAETGEQVSISVAALDWSFDLDLYLEIYGPDGELITADDDSGWRFNPALYGFELPQSGLYTIEVSSYAGASAGDFSLSIAEGTAYLAPDGSSARPLPLDGGVAILEVSLGENEAILYELPAQAGDTISIQGLSDTLLADVYATDGGGIQLNNDDPFVLPFTNTYVLIVYSQEGSASTLTLNLSAEPSAIDTPSAPQIQGTVALDQPSRGILSLGEVHIWGFSPTLAGEYTFALLSEDESGRYDPYLVLRDADGEILAEDDDSGGNFNALISDLSLNAGESITIEVGSFAGLSEGAYRLQVVSALVDAPPPIAGGTLSLGQTTLGNLSAAAQQAQFDLSLSETSRLSLSLEGLLLPYIDVYDANNALVARGVGGIRALNLAAGEYRVIVFDRLNAVGDFSLSVTAD